MAPCGGNIVTPKMIKKGQIQVGDRIKFEDAAVVSGPAAVAPESAAEQQDSREEKAVEVQNMTAPQMQSNTVDDNGVTRRQVVQGAGNMSQAQTRPQVQQTFPLNFAGMTDYVNSQNNQTGQNPSFNVPSHPMVPPEYEQTIDYDSIQYMNGFLRTQIGRYVTVEQLIGSGNTEERFGFLVGVGNNYLLLQDISNGNILVIDFYSVKFVYIYFGEPIFPNIPFGPSVG